MGATTELLGQGRTDHVGTLYKDFIKHIACDTAPPERFSAFCRGVPRNPRPEVLRTDLLSQSGSAKGSICDLDVRSTRRGSVKAHALLVQNSIVYEPCCTNVRIRSFTSSIHENISKFPSVALQLRKCGCVYDSRGGIRYGWHCR